MENSVLERIRADSGLLLSMGLCLLVIKLSVFVSQEEEGDTGNHEHPGCRVAVCVQHWAYVHLRV